MKYQLLKFRECGDLIETTNGGMVYLADGAIHEFLKDEFPGHCADMTSKAVISIENPHTTKEVAVLILQSERAKR